MTGTTKLVLVGAVALGVGVVLAHGGGRASDGTVSFGSVWDALAAPFAGAQLGGAIGDGLVGGAAGAGSPTHRCADDPNCTVTFAGLDDGAITQPWQI